MALDGEGDGNAGPRSKDWGTHADEKPCVHPLTGSMASFTEILFVPRGVNDITRRYRRLGLVGLFGNPLLHLSFIRHSEGIPVLAFEGKSFSYVCTYSVGLYLARKELGVWIKVVPLL